VRECKYPLSLAAALAVCLIGVSASKAAQAQPPDLTQLGLEELLNLKVEVTSAAKKPQFLNDVAAAAFVVTGDDIRRSGATSIPEALRFVPGLDVARVDRNSWAISARGFNSTFADKLLVLIDGRSVYSPLFSGVFWSLQDTLIEDVDRIEVIRGPGAALWGANAVDGVINIITKPASETQGTLLVAGAGTEKTGFGAVRQGGSFGADGHYRVYAQYNRRAPGTAEAGGSASDDSLSREVGFRTDWKGSAADAFTLLGGVNAQKRGESSVIPTYAAPYSSVVNNENNDLGANLLGRWTHTISADSNLSVQTYYTHEGYERPDVATLVDVADIEFQHRFSPAQDHDVIWGAGYRWSHASLYGTPNFFFVPAVSAQSLPNAFVQDDWTLVPQRLHLIGGIKFEHNDFSGFEVQPSLRLLWTPDSRQSIWVAASRAVRTPSVGQEFTRGLLNVVPPNPPGVPFPTGIEIVGNRGVLSEKVIALETGYRVSPAANLSFDSAFFYNFNKDLVSEEPQALILPPPHLVQPMLVNNGYAGDSFGAEIASEWKPMPAWRLRASYSYLRMMLHLTDQNTPPVILATANQSPHHQFVLQSSSDLGHDVEFDISLKHVSDLSAFSVGEYTTVDTRLAWNGIEGLELSVVGQNLFDGSRLQFQPDLLPWVPTKVGPSFYGKAVIRF